MDIRAINCQTLIKTVWLTLLATTLLANSGCVTQQVLDTAPPEPPPEQIDWVEHVRQLTLLTEWQLQGKIGIKQRDDGGSAYINWTQAEDSFYIRLSGPLGSGTTIISGNDSGAKLESASDGTFIAESPEQLLYEHTGWHLPLHNLLYWVKGLPEPRLPAITEFDERGYLSRLIQGPWQLDFYRYQNALDVTLPHKIKIYNQDLKVTLVIKNWEPLTES
ncbi:MAG: lipoprotein insertase outer membrane protein LolB [Ketobacteraceae bacterium]|nr:lipoprotein insertase outer membrane protein LolB [Ketobacteraceae bacterium]